MKKTGLLVLALLSLSILCEAKTIKGSVVRIKDTPEGRVLQVEDYVGFKPQVYDCLITDSTELSGISDVKELEKGRIIYVELDDVVGTGKTIKVHGRTRRTSAATALKITVRKDTAFSKALRETLQGATEQMKQETAAGVDQSKLFGKDWVDVSPWNPFSNDATRPFVRFSPDGTYQQGRDGRLEGTAGHYQWVDGRHLRIESNTFEVVAFTDNNLQLKLPDGKIQVFNANVVSALQGMQQQNEQRTRQEQTATAEVSGPNAAYRRAMMICLQGNSPEILNFGPVFSRDSGKVAKATVRTTRQKLSPIDQPQPEVSNVEAVFEKADDGILYLTRITFPLAAASCSVAVR